MCKYLISPDRWSQLSILVINKRDYQNGLPGFRVEKGIVMIYQWHFFSLNVKWCVVVLVFS